MPSTISVALLRGFAYCPAPRSIRTTWDGSARMVEAEQDAHRRPSAMDEDEGHEEHERQPVLQRLLTAFAKRLGAVAALQEERFALRDICAARTRQSVILRARRSRRAHRWPRSLSISSGTTRGGRRRSESVTDCSDERAVSG